ncbi:hypothetical protein A2121_01845 [Candidatus Nomurabacteria bacterium GWB1_40_6]|uniref:Glycosidase n=1 Tax=Candidatus Nomurabacteria bacterium GWB1_40_6 TaxID=1801727 RepID=A0A1F6TPE4_9BACT|nr:MAG: hypothetical protein A2121_01845 [Candidatus Nomurabacteria bacterium GWB1_40_6]
MAVLKKLARRGGKKKIIKKMVKKVVKKTTKKVSVKRKTLVKKLIRRTKKIVKKYRPKISKAQVLRKKSLSILKKFKGNPIMGPLPSSSWESEAVLNPGAVVHDGRVHLFYRALGRDGISRIGYVSSNDGINFNGRLSYPVFVAKNIEETKNHYPYTSPARFVFDPNLYTSGGGWGGCEDPRAVKIDGRIYLTFNMFNGWESMRVAFTSIDEKDLSSRKWNWNKFAYLSRPGDRQKNWVLFPEKINGKFALFYNLDKGDSSRVHIAYVDKLDMWQTPSQKEAVDPQTLPDHIVTWHNRTRSAAAPPIKTSDGWLLFYHAMDKDDPNRYKVGALLLDLKDPTKVLYRSSYPLLQPDEWYENDYKPGVVYASGAIVKDGTLFLYYGGGDKHIAVAHTNLKEFIKKLKNKEQAIFSRKAVKVE